MWALPIGGGAALVILVIVVWNRLMGHEIAQRKKAQAELTVANRKLGEAMEHIEGSINYASRIQRSVLPHDDLLAQNFKDYFVLWEPRDVVGGDIYWCRLWGQGALLMLGDCTGHGVPGAFMTLIATGALDQADPEVSPGDVATLIQRLHVIVQTSLGQDKPGGESDDGLELGACYLPADKSKMVFAGARFDLFVVEDGSVKQIKGTRKGIGYRGIPHDQEYQVQEIALRDGQAFYMSSDGLIDQVGGKKGRSFGKKRFTSLLTEIATQPMAEQRDSIQRCLIDYQGKQSRRDDLSVVGFQVG